MIDALELVFGLPPLVCGLAGGWEYCEFSGIAGGEIVMLGVSGGSCDFGLSFVVFEVLEEKSVKPAGRVETGR